MAIADEIGKRYRPAWLRLQGSRVDSQGGGASLEKAGRKTEGMGLTRVGLRTRREVTGCPLRRQVSPTTVPGDSSGSYLYGGNL